MQFVNPRLPHWSITVARIVYDRRVCHILWHSYAFFLPASLNRGSSWEHGNRANLGSTSECILPTSSRHHQRHHWPFKIVSFWNLITLITKSLLTTAFLLFPWIPLPLIFSRVWFLNYLSTCSRIIASLLNRSYYCKPLLEIPFLNTHAHTLLSLEYFWLYATKCSLGRPLHSKDL